MARVSIRNGNGERAKQGSKYDAQNTVLSKTYGALADLRRELSDSKAAVTEREELLRSFAHCPDSQRAWLLLEDYFEKLSLSRKDFPNTDWWPRVVAAQGQARLEKSPSSSSARGGPCRPSLPLTATRAASPRSRRLRGSSNLSKALRTGSFRQDRRTWIRPGPDCASFAGLLRTSRSRHGIASLCSFSSCVRALAKKQSPWLNCEN
jgi:hypothetical protein